MDKQEDIECVEKLVNQMIQSLRWRMKEDVTREYLIQITHEANQNMSKLSSDILFAVALVMLAERDKDVPVD